MTAAERNERIWIPSDAWLGIEKNPAQDGRLFLLMALVLATVVRVFALGSDSLWIDEFYTWSMCNPGPGHGMWEQIRDMIQGPLHLALVWPLAHGRLDEALIRMPSVVAGIATTPLVWLLGRRIAGERAGRFAALLWALAPFAVWYGREARGYGLAMFFATAATLQWLRMAQGRVRVAGAVGYGLLSALAVLSNFSAVFLIVGHGLATIVCFRPRERSAWFNWGLAFLVAAAICSPWLLRSLGIHAMERLAPGADTGAPLRGETTFTPLGYPFAFLTFFFGYSLGPSLAELHRPDRIELVRQWLPLIAPAGLIAAFAVLAGFWRLRGRRTAFLLILLLLPCGLLTVLALQNIKTFNPRYLAAAQPLALITAAAGIAAMSRLCGRITGTLLVGLMIYSLFAGWSDPRYHKEDSRAAAETIAARGLPAEPILVPDLTDLFALYYHGPGRIVDFWDDGVIADPAAAQAALARRIGEAEGCWLVRSERSLQDPHDLLAPALLDRGRIVASEDYSGLRVLRWRRSAVPVFPIPAAAEPVGTGGEPVADRPR